MTMRHVIIKRGNELHFVLFLSTNVVELLQNALVPCSRLCYSSYKQSFPQQPSLYSSLLNTERKRLSIKSSVRKNMSEIYHLNSDTGDSFRKCNIKHHLTKNVTVSTITRCCCCCFSIGGICE